MKPLRVFTYVTLLLAGTIILPIPAPKAAAQVVDEWQLEVPGVPIAPDELAIGRGGTSQEDVMLAFIKTGASAPIGIAFRDSATNTWSIKTTDATGGAPAAASALKVDYAAGAWWLHYWNDEATDKFYFWRSTDNGATWSLKLSPTGGSTAIDQKASHDVAEWTNTRAAVMYHTSSTRLHYQETTDGGTTWTTANPINDDNGSPGSSGTVVPGFRGASMQIGSGVFSLEREAMVVFASSPGGNYYVTTSSDGSFWKVPYDETQSGGLTCYNRRINGGANECAQWTSNSCGGCTITARASKISRTLGLIGLERSSTSTSSTGTEYVHIGPGMYDEAIIPGCGSGCDKFYRNGIHTLSYIIGAPPSNGGPCNYLYKCGSITLCSTREAGKAEPGIASNSRRQTIFTLSCTTDSNTKIYYQATPTSAWVTSLTLPHISEDVESEETPTWFYSAVTNSSLGGQVQVYRVQTPPVPEVPSTGVTVSDLTGFQADPFNQVVIWRKNTEGSREVHSLNPTTLAERANSPASSSCNQVAGLMGYVRSPAAPQYVAFTRCNGSGVQTGMSILAGDLGNPDQSGTVCSDFCTDDDNGFTDFNEDDNQLAYCVNSWDQGGNPNAFPQTGSGAAFHVGAIAAIPIDFTAGLDLDGNTGSDEEGRPRMAHVQVGFVFSSQNAIGAYLWNFINGQDDFSCVNYVPFGASANHLCSWRGPDGKSYVVAVSLDAQTKVWRIDVDPIRLRLEGAVSRYTAGIRLTAVQALPAPYDQAYGVGCSGEDALIRNASGTLARVGLLNNTGQAQWTKTGCAASPRGVAFSGDGKWGACHAGATTLVFDAETGTTVGTLTTPAGVFQDLDIDDTGQVLWVATNTRIEKFHIYPYTTGNPVPPGSRNGDCVDLTGQPCSAGEVFPDPDEPAAGLPGVDQGAVAIALGISEGAAGWILGLFFFVALAGGLFFLGGRGAPALGIVGGIVATGVNVGVGLWPLWFILVLVLFGATVVVLKFKPGGVGG